MKNKYVKIVLLCLRNLTELTETAVANRIQQAGRALNGSNVSNTSVCQTPVVTLATCQSVEAKRSFIQANVKWKQQKSLKCCSFPSSNMKKMPNAPDNCDDCILSNLFSICYTLTSHLYLFFIFFLFFPPNSSWRKSPLCFITTKTNVSDQVESEQGRMSEISVINKKEMAPAMRLLRRLGLRLKVRPL